MEIFKLFGSILVDSSQAEQSIQKTDSKAKGFASTLGNGLKKVGSVAAGIADKAASAAVAAGKAIGSVANVASSVTSSLVKGVAAAAEYGDNIDKMSQKIGISAEAYQEWDAIFQHSGTSIDSLQAGMKTLRTAMDSVRDGATGGEVDLSKLTKAQTKYENALLDVDKAQIDYNAAVAKSGENSDVAAKALINLQKAQNKATEAESDYIAAQKVAEPKMSEAALALEQLGISAVTSSGELRSEEEVFAETITALQGMTNETERARYASLIFGKTGTELGALLNTSAEDTEAMRQRVHELGGVMSDEAVKASAAFQDSLQDMTTSFDGIKRGLMSKFLPSLTTVMNKVTDLISKGGITRAVESFGNMLLPIADKVIDFISDLSDEFLPPLLDLLEELSEPVGNMVARVFPVIIDVLKKIMPVAVKIIEKLLPPLLDILEALMPLLDVIMSFLDPILTVISALIDPIAKILNDLIKPLVEVLVKLTEKTLGKLGEKLGEFAPLLGDILGGALMAISDLISDVLIPAFDGIIKFLDGDFIGGLESWGGIFTGFFDKLFEGIDETFGTHIAEWYDEFKGFMFDIGAGLYEMTHGDEIQMNELNSKYNTMQGDIYDAIKAGVAAGKTAEEALKDAENSLLDTQEKIYFYSQMKASWDTAGVAQGYYEGKDKWLNSYLNDQTYGDEDERRRRRNDLEAAVHTGRPPRLASGGIATGSTLAMVGDNPDVRVNPEVIAPLSDLSDMIFTGFSRALDRYAESRWEERSVPAKQSLTVIVQLADGTELTRAIIDNINEIARQDGKSPLKGI